MKTALLYANIMTPDLPTVYPISIPGSEVSVICLDPHESAKYVNIASLPLEYIPLPVNLRWSSWEGGGGDH